MRIEFYASELKELLRETLKHSIAGEFSAHSEDPIFTQKNIPVKQKLKV